MAAAIACGGTLGRDAATVALGAATARAAVKTTALGDPVAVALATPTGAAGTAGTSTVTGRLTGQPAPVASAEPTDRLAAQGTGIGHAAPRQAASSPTRRSYRDPTTPTPEEGSLTSSVPGRAPVHAPPTATQKSTAHEESTGRITPTAASAAGRATGPATARRRFFSSATRPNSVTPTGDRSSAAGPTATGTEPVASRSAAATAAGATVARVSATAGRRHA